MSATPSQYLGAVRLLESWRVNENIARDLKDRVTHLYLNVGPEEYESALTEYRVARIRADESKLHVLAAMGVD